MQTRNPIVPDFTIPSADEAGRSRRYAQKDAIITVLAEKNPKRNGTLAFDRFALYQTGMTVGEYVTAGGRTGDVNYDEAQGFIVLELQ